MAIAAAALADFLDASALCTVPRDFTLRGFTGPPGGAVKPNGGRKASKAQKAARRNEAKGRKASRGR